MGMGEVLDRVQLVGTHAPHLLAPFSDEIRGRSPGATSGNDSVSGAGKRRSCLRSSTSRAAMACVSSGNVSRALMRGRRAT
jgi:hypothetical protein